MVRSCLHVPDASPWHEDDAYNPTVARLLTYAHTQLNQVDVDPSATSLPETLIRPALEWRMSKRQRLSAYYLLARAAMARKEYGDAIACVDQASNLATELLEVGALAELALLRGDACQGLQRFAEVADASWDYLVLVHDPRAGVGPDDVADEIGTLLTVAQSEFLQEHYGIAVDALADAEALIAGRGGFDQARLFIAWTRVLLHRWRGEASTALPIAMEVAEAPSIRDSPQVRGRIETIVADLALDRIETFASELDSPARFTLLGIACQYLERAEASLHDSEDVGGAAMARLARLRYSRLTGAAEERLEAIDELERLGRTTSDDSLVIQALTARGEELLACGKRDQGLAAFRKAVDLARRSQVAAMGMRARRALLYDEELRD